MKFSKRKIVLVASIVVAASIGVAFAYHNLQSETETIFIGKTNGTAIHHLNPNGSELIVRAFKIQTEFGASASKHAFTGTLQPRYQTAIAFRVAGKLSRRLVEIGQRVKKGDILFQLDPEDTEHQLRVAEADQISAASLLKQSAAEELRLAQLRTSGSVSQSEYDVALANRDVAKARLDSANRRLALATNQRTYCDLIADTDGIVTSLSAEAGQVVNIGQTVLQLMQTDELEAAISLPESFVANVKNLRATAAFWSQQDLSIPAELRELSPMADTISRTYDAKFTLKGSTADLAIGMTVTILLSNSAEDGLCIPITSISSRDDAPIVWRIEPISGSVEAVPIEIIQYRNETAVVRGSFRPGDQIVSAGVQRVDEHSKVRVWEGKK